MYCMNKISLKEYEDELISEKELIKLVKKSKKYGIHFTLVDRCNDCFNIRVDKKKGEGRMTSDYEGLMAYVARTENVRKTIEKMGGKLRYFEAGQIGFDI